jgi:hypothetical protein
VGESQPENLLDTERFIRLRRSVYTSFLIVDVLTNISDLEDEKKSSDFFEIGGVRQNPDDEKNPSGFFEVISSLLFVKSSQVEEPQGFSQRTSFFSCFGSEDPQHSPA